MVHVEKCQHFPLSHCAFSVWARHEQHMTAHLAVHLLKDVQLSSLIGPVICVIALVPVCHHPPALEGSLLTSYGPLCKRPCWMGGEQGVTAAANLTCPSSFLSVFTFLSDLQWTKAASPQLPQRLQLDGQAMAVPAWDVVDLSPPQHLKTVTDIFQDLD